MASSLFPTQPKSQMNNSMNNPFKLMSELKNFMSSGITADKAEEIVKSKINSGEMSMEQFEQLKSQAQQFQNMLSFMK